VETGPRRSLYGSGAARIHFDYETSRGEKNMFTAKSTKQVKFIRPSKPSKPIQPGPPAKATKKITPEILKVR